MHDVIDHLRADGLLTDPAAAAARQLVTAGKSLEDSIIAADGVTEEQLLRSLAKMFELPYVDLEKNAPTKEYLAAFPARLLVIYKILPLSEENGVTTVAVSRLTETHGLDELRLVTGRECAMALASAGDIDRALKRILGVGADTLQSLNAEAGIQVVDSENENDLDQSNAAHDASIIRFVNQVLTEAIDVRATDVHIEPFEDQLRLRYRIDGVLQEANVPPSIRRFHAAIVSRLKILSHLDIAEKRLPQDGRIKLKLTGREIDVRVSIIPMIHGEAVVLRLLHRSDALLGTQNLGMSPRDARLFDDTLELPHGIVLVTGPTGSGKTTTLYAALARINDTERKIITIEDPVEYQLRGVNQIQVSAKTGLTFGAGLRAILRHDPDVVLVGEIRDRETAEIAVQASLTGHLVFSTLHTNDAPGAATRLIDMGIEPYLVASSLELVIAQRLVRTICKECKREVLGEEYAKAKEQFGDLVPEKLFEGAGCRNCQNTGFRGRQAIFEIMPITDEVRSLTLQRTASHTLRKIAVQQGMNSLRDDGWRIVAQGRTTIKEVLTNTKDEELGLRYADEPAVADASSALSAITAGAE